MHEGFLIRKEIQFQYLEYSVLNTTTFKEASYDRLSTLTLVRHKNENENTLGSLLGLCKLRMTRNQTSQQASELYANFLRKKKKKKKKKICHSFQQVYCAQRGGKRCLLVSITFQKQSYPTY